MVQVASIQPNKCPICGTYLEYALNLEKKQVEYACCNTCRRSIQVTYVDPSPSPGYRLTNLELGKDKQTSQPVSLPETERTYHTGIIGQTRYGKTSLLERMVIEDMKQDINAIVFDPHGDLTEDLLLQAASAQKADRVLLYEITANSSYVFNPVEIKNNNDPMEVSRTVDSLMQVFRKHWTTYAWGPRVEWVLSNCIRTLVANPGHTLDEIPLLLRDDAFRSRFLPQITNPQVQEFWRWYRTLESTRRPQDEWQLIKSTLTRLSQFLANEWLVRILYQPVSTVDFSQIINNTAGQLTIFSLPIGRLGEEPAALLGSLLLGRLATTIFGRIDYGAQLPRLHIYIDELSRFSLPITARLWTEGGKYNIGLTATLQTLSQLQDEENKSAVLQAGNHICFQLIGDTDARVMAAQMPLPDPTSLMKPEPLLLFSQTAVEDIWHKGHPDKVVMISRDIYFWIVGALESDPKEEYWWFDAPKALQEEPEWSIFTDWDMYRSSASMLKQGIALLDQYYYNWMNHKYILQQETTQEELQLVLKIVECFSGVLGIRPVMEPYIEEGKWRYLLQQMQDQYDRLEDRFIKDREEHMGTFHVPEQRAAMRWELQKLHKQFEQQTGFKRIPVNELPFVFHPQEIPGTRKLLLNYLNLPMHEVDQLIQWKIREISGSERKMLTNIIKNILDTWYLKDQGREKEGQESADAYGAFMMLYSLSLLLGKDWTSLSKEEKQQYDKQYKTTAARMFRQRQDLQNLVGYVCKSTGFLLEKEPLYVPSQSYQDVEYSRRTYADVRDELAQRLVSLPRYEAIAALVSEGKTVHIKTIPLPSLSPAAQTDAQFIRSRSRQQVNKPMQEIMDALKKRTRPADPGNLPTPKPHI